MNLSRQHIGYNSTSYISPEKLRIQELEIKVFDQAIQIEELKEEFKKLQEQLQELKYRPGGVEYYNAKEHFEKISKR